jgi:hypothetical protein
VRHWSFLRFFAAGAKGAGYFGRYGFRDFCRVGTALLWLCSVPWRFANGVSFRCRDRGCGLGSELWAMVAANFRQVLGYIFVPCEENFQKSANFYKIFLCKCKKMGYNKKKNPHQTERRQL